MARLVTVTVRPKAGLRDPEGATIEEALEALGHTNVGRVHVGKQIDLLVEGDSDDEILAQVDGMCRTILANPVIEDFEIAVGGRG